MKRLLLALGLLALAWFALGGPTHPDDVLDRLREHGL
jgi:hypothetical protein